MLAATEIAKLIRTGAIGWHGDLRGDGLLARLGSPLQGLASFPNGVVDLADQASINTLYPVPLQQWDTFDIEPGQLVLCQASVPLRLGPGHAGAISTLSHLARVGLATHIDSPWILPGWAGYVTLELFNAGPATLRVHRNMPAARILLFAMDGAVGQAQPHGFYGAADDQRSRYADEFPIRTYQR
jgi:deoxycytidine triphosphate deaminase